MLKIPNWVLIAIAIIIGLMILGTIFGIAVTPRTGETK